jgi:hypothetical protein
MEQQRYIRALEAMIKLGKGYIRIARPQVSLAPCIFADCC